MNLVERVKNIIVQPKLEWPVIAAESHTVQDLYTKYVMLLVAIAPVASFIGYSLVGMGGFGVTYRIPIGAGVAYMVLSYVLSLGAVYVVALAIDALAPTFGGQKDFMQAFKLAAFAPTAAWLAGIFSLIPALAILGLVGLYSIYLLYLGLPVLMKVPEDKAIPYLVVLVIVFLVLGLVIAGISSLAMPSPMRGF